MLPSEKTATKYAAFPSEMLHYLGRNAEEQVTLCMESPVALLQQRVAVWCGWQAGGMALSAKLCHVLRDAAPEMKCYQSNLQSSCHGDYKMGNHWRHLYHCHMSYGEILAPLLWKEMINVGFIPSGWGFFV